MQPRELRVGEILQLNPETTRNKAFAAGMFVVREPLSFGALGYVQMLGENCELGGPAFYRAKWEELEPTGGIAVWVAE